ncbi:MAG: phosphoenolpyruvate synthase [Chloroflexi bacterium]|nr:phosphoenolpyruvate synthase [Chloroflexota bacterium]
MSPDPSGNDRLGDRPLVLPFAALGAADLPLVGGKGANLGEMTRAGLPVPPGFCVTTEAFRRFVAGDPELEPAVYARLAALAPDDVAGVREAGQAIRARLLALPVPAEVEQALLDAWRRLGPDAAYALRSSATAEDLPGASFAGQQDSFLNLRGREALVDALRRAWVSLFTDRAILYRAQNGFDHREVRLSAVVQRMVLSEVSGILFTADPLSGNRHVASIDAGFGLGEALVSGIVSADNFRVDKRSGAILERRVADKRQAIRPRADGGTETVPLAAGDSRRASLSDAQARALTELGSRVEAHFGRPQDIEWVIDAAGDLFLVQSRPITSLFPLPEPGPTDGGLHAYASLGHAQVMTDAMTPMGRSVFPIILPFGKSGDPGTVGRLVSEAGGRLYADFTPALHFAPSRALILRFLGVADPLMAGAMRALVARPAFREGPAARPPKGALRAMLHWVGPILLGLQRRLWLADPDTGLAEVAGACEALVEDSRARMAAAPPGAARLDEARQALGRALPTLLRVMPPVMGAGYAGRAILGRLAGSRARPGDLDAIVRGLQGNVTTDMDLAVGDLADLARLQPELARRLAGEDLATAIADIARFPEGADFLAAWHGFLDRYGLRGPSEIDIGRPRWHEAPASLLKMVAGHLRAEPGAHRAHQRRMAEAGQAAGERLVEAAAHGLLAPLRARLARRCLRLVRGGMPVREHPKFALIQILGLTKDAIREAAEPLLSAGRLDRADDVFWLRLPELIEGLRRPGLDLRAIVARRKAEEARYASLRPPRVITSEGEIPEVAHVAEDLPPGALPGISASAGVVEGLARVVLDPSATLLAPGEILVAPFTDPGWTPLFIHAAALVMEVGGLMTHGSVVAREYGIPAVVGVLEATRRIQTGQRLRVDGNRGFVQILAEADAEGGT